jgi:RNA polymerase sigma factor (sigma-70 family)
MRIQIRMLLNRYTYWMVESVDTFGGCSDCELLGLVASGNEIAFEVLYRRYADRIYRAILMRLNSPDEAEELTSDVFLLLWRKCKKIQIHDDGSLYPWLYAVARKSCMSTSRRGRSRLRLLSKLFQVERSGNCEQLNLDVTSQEENDLLELVHCLSSGEREIVTLRVIDGLTHAQIANLLGITVAASRTRLSRAVASLRRHYASGSNVALGSLRGWLD